MGTIGGKRNNESCELDKISADHESAGRDTDDEEEEEPCSEMGDISDEDEGELGSKNADGLSDYEQEEVMGDEIDGSQNMNVVVGKVNITCVHMSDSSQGKKLGDTTHTSDNEEEVDEDESDDSEWDFNEDDQRNEAMIFGDINKELFKPLYDGAKMSTCGAYFAIMHFKSSCRLSFSTIKHLLQLLHLFCPKKNNLPKSVYNLRKFFKFFRCTQVKEQYCLSCQEKVEDRCMNENCPSEEPQCFIQMDIVPQVKTVLSRHWYDLQHSEIEENIVPTIGSKTMLSHQASFFSHREHLGLILNTDGISLFKSSKTSAWPVFFEIANLPPTLRFRHDNVLTAGFWVGQHKPDMDILLQSIMKKVDFLNAVGFKFKSPEGHKTVRVRTLFGVFDLIAKAPVLNMKQFNGQYGCPTCLHPGEISGRGTRTYPPTRVYPLRTSACIKKAVARVQTTGKTVLGIKGKSVLTGYLDLMKGIPFDYMHSVLEGVVKSLLTVWTNSKYHREPYSIRKDLNDIDNYLLRQYPPHEFTRPPRSIKSHLAFWKANEFRVWLLFYSLPLLLNSLPPLYFHHFALLVCAIHIFLQKEVSQQKCDLAEKMLIDFNDLVPVLYGMSMCTMNVHSLIHLPMFVKLWGPLWCQSSFSFESHNGNLTRMIHSTRKVAEQVSCALDVKQSLQILYTNLENEDSEFLVEYLKYSRPCHSTTKTQMTTGYAVSPIRSEILSIADYNEIKKLCSQASTEVLCFDKLLYNGFILHSTSIDKKGKRKSTYFSYMDDTGEEQFGEIVMFIECSSFDTFALINTFSKIQSDILTSSGRPCYPILEAHSRKGLISEFIVEVAPSNSSRSAILVSSIISNCVLVESRSSQHYIVKVPNNFEHH